MSCADTVTAVAFRRCRVAVVDDHDAVRAAVAAALDDAGYDVVACAALAAGAALAAFVPDVVLLELALPALRADALLGLLRRQPRLARTRFFLHSSLSGPALRAAAVRCGADGVVGRDVDVVAALAAHGFAALR